MVDGTKSPGDPLKLAAVMVAPSNTYGVSTPLTNIRRVL
jgi:hypothetical protein